MAKTTKAPRFPFGRPAGLPGRPAVDLSPSEVRRNVRLGARREPEQEDAMVRPNSALRRLWRAAVDEK